MKELQQLKETVLQLTKRIEELETQQNKKPVFNPQIGTFWKDNDGAVYYLCRIQSEYFLVCLTDYTGNQNWCNPADTPIGAFAYVCEDAFTQITLEELKDLL